MGLLRMKAVRQSGLMNRLRGGRHKDMTASVSNHAQYMVIMWIAENANDYAPVDEMHRATLEDMDAALPLSKVAIKRVLTRLGFENTIQAKEPPNQRYKPMWDVIISDTKYLETLDGLFRERAKKEAKRNTNGREYGNDIPLVSDQIDHSFGNDQIDHSQNERTAPNGQTDHSRNGNDQFDRSHSKKKDPIPPKKGRKDHYLEKINNLKYRPTFLPQQPKTQMLIREMLDHPSIKLDPDFIEPIAEVFDPKWVFNTCCQFLADRERGTISSTGALLYRFAHPNQIEAPNSPLGNTDFYYEFTYRIETSHADPNRGDAAGAAALELADDSPTADSDEREPIAYSTRQENRCPEDIGTQVLHELRFQLPQTTFETWVRDISISSYTEGEFIVSAPHVWARDWLQNRLSKKVKQILAQLTGHSVQVSFEVRNKQQDRSDTVGALQEDPAPEPAVEAAASPTETKPEVLDDAQDRIATQKVRLLELVETRTRDRYQYNQIIQAINAEIAAVNSEQLTAAEKDDRICELIARCIAILEDQTDSDLTAPNGNSRDTVGSADLELADGAPAGNEQDQHSANSLLLREQEVGLPNPKAKIEHSHQRQLRRPQPRKKTFIPAEQIPVITTEQIPFAAIAADWDEPWMVEAITEFKRRMQPWLDLDTGDDPIRIEATYNPDRPLDTPHIFNMKHAYTLQQRISSEQRVGAGLSDPLAPLIEAHQARPHTAGRH